MSTVPVHWIPAILAGMTGGLSFVDSAVKSQLSFNFIQKR